MTASKAKNRQHKAYIMNDNLLPENDSITSLKIQTCIPAFGIAFLHIFYPGLIPRVSKIHQQHQLDQNEKESSTRTYDKPCCNDTEPHRSFSSSSVIHSHVLKNKGLTVGERPIWNIKGTNSTSHQGNKLIEPVSENELSI